jgi:hypothetical protein
MFKLLKIYFNDTLRGMLFFIIALLIACPLSIFVFLVPYWEHNREQLGDWVLIAAFILWMAVFLGSIAAIILTVTWKRKKWLDAVFTPLGLKGRPYLINWWEYHGLLDGRSVIARFYRGPTLTITIQTNLKTRFGIAEQEQPELFLADFVNKHPLQALRPELNAYAIFAMDEAWTSKLLQSEEVLAPLQRLMQAGESWALIRQVILAPGALRLMLYRNKNLMNYNFNAAEVRQWAADLLALIHAAENLPAPTITTEENWAENMDRTGKTMPWAITILGGFFVLCGLCVAVSIWLLVWLDL